jgi:hypothetical protein
MDMRRSDVSWRLILQSLLLLRLSETSFYLLLLLHGHIREILSTRSTLALLLHPLHLLLLSHLLLLLWQVSRHFSFFVYRICFLEINLWILAQKVLWIVLILWLLRCTLGWCYILSSLQTAQISTNMQRRLRSCLLLLMKRYLMIELLKNKLRVV